MDNRPMRLKDPFGYTARSRAIGAALRPPSHPSHSSMWGGLGHALGAILHGHPFGDDNFRNQFGLAQAGRLNKIDPHGLTPHQIHLIMQIMAGKSHGY